MRSTDSTCFTCFNALLQDTDAANLMPHLESTVDFMHEALVKGNGVLVHCMQGVSRSPSFVIAYLMKAEKKKLLEAYKSVKAIRPQAKPKPHFLKQLLAWEKILSGTGGAGESWPGGLGGGLASKDGVKVLSLPREPQLPPSTPGVEGVGSAHGSPDSGERAAVKGPMMPPRLAGPSTGCSPDQGALSGERKQAALVKGLGKGPGRGPLKGPVKGPAMPPHLMHRSSSRDFEDPPEPAAPAAKKRKT